MHDIDRYVSLAQSVSSHAQAGTLASDTAVAFCRSVLPALLVELELAKRVDARLSQMFPAPAAEACEATICSSRWRKPAAAKKAKAKKKAVKKARKTQKEVKDDRVSS